MILAIDTIALKVSPSLPPEVPVPNDTNTEEDVLPPKWANGRSAESKYRENIEARTGSHKNQDPVRLHDEFNWERTKETQNGIER